MAKTPATPSASSSTNQSLNTTKSGPKSGPKAPSTAPLAFDFIQAQSLAGEDYEKNLARLRDLAPHYAEKPLPHFCPLVNVQEIAAFAEPLMAFRSVIILGTGGSSLGGQVLYDHCGEPARELIFVDNLDPHSFSQLLQNCSWSETGVLAISKSGNTPETIFQTAAILARLTSLGIKPNQHMAAIAGSGDNSLRRLAARHGFAVDDHVDEIGGRYSVLTNVGLLPGYLAGYDIAAMIDGAQGYIAPYLAGETIAAEHGAALMMALARAGRTQSVVFSYADRLASLGQWYRQLWAESLGKDGIAATPISALGPVDQHSQLQLYLDGADDKVFTFLILDQGGLGTDTGSILDDDEDNRWLGGLTMGDVVTAQARATADSLSARQRPVRRIQMRHLDARTLGALFMHFMAETILSADLVGVNAFDQPAVEESKILTKRYLTADAKA